VGFAYYRLHPKGKGMVCARPGGIEPFTFVEEYVGEIHTGWRWFEIQVRCGWRWSCPGAAVWVLGG
jgi:hypothetical protein